MFVRTEYLFNSKRLGFRNWNQDDLETFAQLNADPEVMKHFPSLLTRNESSDFFQRLIVRQRNYNHSYFATEIIDSKELIGFIGLAYQTYPSHFTPATDIGWRLKKSAWGKGYATEGVLRNLEYAFDTLGKKKLFSTCTKKNVNSEKVMKKIGMRKIEHFDHPRLLEFPDLKRCVRYEISIEEYYKQKAHLPL